MADERDTKAKLRGAVAADKAALSSRLESIKTLRADHLKDAHWRRDQVKAAILAAQNSTHRECFVGDGMACVLIAV
jgi:hypothetical protein